MNVLTRLKGHFCLVCQRHDCRQFTAEHRLTAREFSVIALVGQGLTNEAIALRLGLAAGTVKVYLSRLYRKLPLTDSYTGLRSAAILWWMQRPELHEIVRLDRPELL